MSCPTNQIPESSTRRFAILALVAGSMSVVVSTVLGQRDAFDFQLYAQAAATLAAGQDPYAQEYEAMLGGHTFSGYYFYPPLLAVALSWFILAGAPLSADGWFAINCGVVGVGAIALAEFVAGCGARLRWQILLVVSVYLWPPTLDGLEFGQINPFVFSALALALLELRREAWTRCGGWIGFAAAVKMSPAILLFSLLFARTRRGIVAFCVVLFIGLAVGVCSPRGIQIYDDCLRGISPLAKGARNWEIPENYSLARLLGYALEDLSATALMGVVAVLSLLLFGVMEVCIRHRSGEQIQRHFALTVIVMILASPIVWFHHLIWALVPLTVALVVSNRSGRGAVILVSLLLGLSLYLDVSYQLWFTGGFEANRALWVGPVVVVIPLVVVALVLLQSDRRNLERL